MLRKLINEKDHNIFEIIQYIQKTVYSYNGNFKLSYNPKSFHWILKGRLISLINKGFKDDKFIYASNLKLLNTKFLKQLKKYLEKEYKKSLEEI
jgi:hypothetical protein